MGIPAGKLCCRGTRSTKRSLNNQRTASGKDPSPCSGHKAKISSRYRVEVSCPLDQPCAALDIREKGEGKAQKPPPRPLSPRSSRSGSSWTSRPAGLNFCPWMNSNLVRGHNGEPLRPGSRGPGGVVVATGLGESQLGWAGDSLLPAQRGGKPVTRGGFTAAAAGVWACLGVPTSALPTGSKVGVLGVGFRKGLAGKCLRRSKRT